MIGSILNIASDHSGTGINHTGMLRKANLSHGSLCRLMARLLQADMINEDFHDGQRIYSITSKGVEYLEKQRQFASLIEAFGVRL
jgi:predicted transcriptional regulator